MKIHIEMYIMGPTTTIALRIKDGIPDNDGHYKLLNLFEEKVDLPFSGKGCNLKPMASSLRKIPGLIKAKRQSSNE